MNIEHREAQKGVARNYFFFLKIIKCRSCRRSSFLVSMVLTIARRYTYCMRLRCRRKTFTDVIEDQCHMYEERVLTNYKASFFRMGNKIARQKFYYSLALRNRIDFLTLQSTKNRHSFWSPEASLEDHEQIEKANNDT